jgi:signal transduction histidine kinase
MYRQLHADLEAARREIEDALAELRATQQRLIQSEKMASLGQLTAGIAHEIKNPLNFVNNFAALSREIVADLENETDPNEQQALLADLKINAEKIEEHGRRADSIVRQMMEHAHSGSGNRETVVLNALMEEYVNLAYHGMRARHPEFDVVVRRQLADDAGEVELVPPEIGRVLINILDNAFDALRKHAREADRTYTPTVTVSTRRGAAQVEIQVSDNGPGMADGVRQKVFEPFYTTKPTGEGTGLGLSLAYDIVTKGHNGTLTVDSKAGHGATFVLTLPIQ